jgi:hypothetical protein
MSLVPASFQLSNGGVSLDLFETPTLLISDPKLHWPPAPPSLPRLGDGLDRRHLQVPHIKQPWSPDTGPRPRPGPDPLLYTQRTTSACSVLLRQPQRQRFVADNQQRHQAPALGCIASAWTWTRIHTPNPSLAPCGCVVASAASIKASSSTLVLGRRLSFFRSGL